MYPAASMPEETSASATSRSCELLMLQWKAFLRACGRYQPPTSSSASAHMMQHSSRNSCCAEAAATEEKRGCDSPARPGHWGGEGGAVVEAIGQAAGEQEQCGAGRGGGAHQGGRDSCTCRCADRVDLFELASDVLPSERSLAPGLGRWPQLLPHPFAIREPA